MKFEIELPDETIDEMTQTINGYGYETAVPSEVLQTVLLLWMNIEGLLVRDDWEILNEKIQVTEL